MNENNETSKETAGLVKCDINDREGLYEPFFVSEEELNEAAYCLPEHIEEEPDKDLFYLTLSPGSVKVSTRKAKTKPKTKNYKPKQPITEWSKKSRANMVAVLATLDYSVMLSGDLTIPALLTLTYPEDWETVAPNAAAAHRHLRLFRGRYERKYKTKLVGIWKTEFQRRGAPHFHIFFVPPNEPGFREWLSKTWAAVVNHPDPNQRAKHLTAGTGLDYGQGLRATDTQRLANYFAKHNAANYGDKEYQNKPPALWLKAGSVGRFWGKWGLPKLTICVSVTQADALFVARVLRRWARSKRPKRLVRVPRVNIKTGEVKYRKKYRPYRQMKQSSGFLTVGDGSKMGQLLAQAIKAKNQKNRPQKLKPLPPEVAARLSSLLDE